MARRRETRDELLQRAERATNEATNLRICTADILAGLEAAKRSCRGVGEGERFTYWLVRPTGAVGGLVLVRYRAPGQRDMVSVYELERLIEMARFGLPEANVSVISEFQVIRQRALDAELAEREESRRAAG